MRITLRTAVGDEARAQTEKWAVIGAGVLGMTLAHRLGDLGKEVTLFEASPRLGGLAAPWQLGEVTWDRHYHVTLLSDARTRAMYEMLGLGDRVRWVETKTGYYGTDAKLRSVSNAVEFLRLPGLRMVDKLRLASTILYGSRVRSGARVERIRVEPWLTRWSGKRTFDVFWKPLLRAKLGDEYTQTSAAFIWSTIQRLYAARRSGIGREKFGYVDGGYDTVCRGFEEHLAKRGVDIRLSTPVRSVRPSTDGSLEVTTAGGAERFDRVVVTTASSLAARLCPDLLANERKRLEEVRYVGIVCVSLLLRRPLADYYLTYITDPSTPFTAVVEMTAFVDPQQLGGHSLVYLPKYATSSHPLFAMDDDRIVAEFASYLRTMYPDLAEEDVLAARVSKVAEVFAVPTLSYSDSAPSIATSVPGLYLAGSANLPFATLNVNDTLSLVDEVIMATGAEG